MEVIYDNLLIGFLQSNKYDYLILDNTHLNQTFLEKTIKFINEYKSEYIVLSIHPSSDLELHQSLNKHGVPLNVLKKQVEDWILCSVSPRICLSGNYHKHMDELCTRIAHHLDNIQYIEYIHISY